jgi:hypothetical protein
MNPGRFFKYATANVGKINLRTQTIRWNSPLNYNDPFDCPQEPVHRGVELRPTKQSNSDWQLGKCLTDLNVQISTLSKKPPGWPSYWS